MSTAKGVWRKPELLVVVRTTSEETVLLACKVPGRLGPMHSNCKFTLCIACKALHCS